MKVAIMQPYFFPYLGYFSLIKHTEQFILFDTVQYIRHGWIDRNRILKPDEGWQYIKVPIRKHSRETSINQTMINNDQDWKSRILGQLQHYKKRAPFYDKVIGLLQVVFGEEYDSIVDLNHKCLDSILLYLDIPHSIKIFSKMNLQIEQVNGPDEWALNICKAMGRVTEYWNPPGGMSFFNREKYLSNSIQLFFQEVALKPYSQKRANFEAGLSILDALMFNSPGEINLMLDQYALK